MADHSRRNAYPLDPIIRQLMIIRESRNIKQARLASMMRCAQGTVSEIECGQIDPKISRIRSYAQALGLSIYLGEEQTFPDLEKMRIKDLIDLYYLLGEELEKRVSCAMNPPQEQEDAHAAQ